MNEHNDRELEQMLAGMPLRRPSAELDQRVLHEAMPTLATVGVHTQRRLAARLGVAAMLIAGATLAITLSLATHNRVDTTGRTAQLPRPPLAPGSIEFEFDPVRHDTLVSHLSDEGVIYLDDDLPVRRIRRQAIRRIEWVDEQRHIRMETTVPHEQWLLVPVRFD